MYRTGTLTVMLPLGMPNLKYVRQSIVIYRLSDRSFCSSPASLDRVKSASVNRYIYYIFFLSYIYIVPTQRDREGRIIAVSRLV